MNYTGTSTYTSLHGVEKEMAAAMPWQIAGAVVSAVLWIAGGWF
jgi:acetyl-CoA decarbonylase/synthase complex subunit gamma